VRHSRLWLGLIAGLALALRLWGIGGKGLAYFDEGQAHLESRFWASAISAWTGENFAGEHLSPHGLEMRLYGSAMLHPKPLHAVLGIPFALATNGSDLTLLLPMALLGGLTVFPIFLLARRWGGDRAGLLAAGLWAISPVALLYGREALAEADAAFFYAWALYMLFACLESDRTPLWAGLLAGAALACNYRWAIALAPFPFLLLRRAQWGKSLLRIGTWALGVILLPLLLLGLYEGLTAWIRGHGVEPGGAGYLGALAFFGEEHGTQGFNLLGLFTLPYVLFRLEGIALLVVYVAGLWWGWRLGDGMRTLFMVGMFPALFFTLHAFHAMRAFFPAWITMIVLGGLWLDWAWKWLTARLPAWAGYAGLLIAVAASLPYIVPSLTVRSGIPEAQEWLNRQGGREFHTQYFVAAVYTNPADLVMPPASAQEIADAPRMGIAWLVTDAQRDLWGYGDRAARNSTVAQYEATHKPVRVVANPAGAHPQFMLEHNLVLGKTITRLGDSANGEIRIYRLP
jgi:4-amino-4-deoxy-L-arabinose transferase-like glycosyltransferase